MDLKFPNSYHLSSWEWTSLLSRFFYQVIPLQGDWENECLVFNTLEFNLFLAIESDENLLVLRLPLAEVGVVLWSLLLPFTHRCLFLLPHCSTKSGSIALWLFASFSIDYLCSALQRQEENRTSFTNPIKSQKEDGKRFLRQNFKILSSRAVRRGGGVGGGDGTDSLGTRLTKIPPLISKPSTKTSRILCSNLFIRSQSSVRRGGRKTDDDHPTSHQMIEFPIG